MIHTREKIERVVNDLWSIYSTPLHVDSEDVAVELFNVIFRAYGVMDMLGEDWNEDQVQPEFYDGYIMENFESAYLRPYSISAYWNAQIPEVRWKNLMYNFLNYRLS